jgi:type VI secretion system protein ImpC
LTLPQAALAGAPFHALAQARRPPVAGQAARLVLVSPAEVAQFKADFLKTLVIPLAGANADFSHNGRRQMPGRMNFEFQLSQPRTRERSQPSEESPMCILVMGDFSGRANRGAQDHSDLAYRKTIMVDVDNFDGVLARMAPRLQLPIGDAGGGIVLELSNLDDFHPDTLCRRLPLFQGLRETRQCLQNTATFNGAAAGFLSEAQRRVEQSAGTTPGQGTKMQTPEGDADTFTRLLGGKPASSPHAAQQTAQHAVDLNALIRNVVAPHIVPDAPPHQAQYIAAVDAATSEQMNSILHHPQFQVLESLWRGVQWLMSNLDLSEQLKLYVLDVSQGELLADIRAAQGNVELSGLYRLLVEQGKGTTGGEPWSVIVGNYAFGLADQDVGLLASLGAIASYAGGPFIAAANPEIVGCDSLAATPDPRDWTPPQGAAVEGWHALRESLMAPWIGLALPRMLLRLPYGKATDSIEQFDFEELGTSREHESYLWGNGAFACALLIGRSFTSRGWDMEPGDELDVEDLPAHTFDDDGEKRLQPCAETNLNDRAGQAILDAGLMPLLSHKNRNSVRVMRLQSIAHPSQPLSGPWG